MPFTQAARRHNAFSGLEKSERGRAVEEQIATAIWTGVLRNGEQLPSEEELSRQLGVATVTLREALVGLRAKGLVETRRGRGGGTFVRSSDDTTREYLRTWLSGQTLEQLRDLSDEHVAINSSAAAIAGERASELDISALRRHVGILGQADSPEARNAADWRFHVEIAAAARSARLTAATSSLLDLWCALTWLGRDSEADAKPSLREHEAVVDAIESRDATAAGNAMASHLRRETAAIAEEFLSYQRPSRNGGARRSAGERALRTGAERAIEPLQTAVDRVMAGLAALQTVTVGLLDGHAMESLKTGDLSPIRETILDHLEQPQNDIIGTGVVFAQDVLADAPRWLEWWWMPVPRTPIPLEADLEPSDTRYYDYEHAPWFTAPRDTGETWISGPFVDFGGTDCQLFTLTVPIYAREQFAGVAGADILASSVERLVTPGLSLISRRAALLNRSGRVIATNTGQWLPGTIHDGVRQIDPAKKSKWTRLKDGGYVLSVPALHASILLGPKD